MIIIQALFLIHTHNMALIVAFSVSHLNYEPMSCHMSNNPADAVMTSHNVITTFLSIKVTQKSGGSVWFYSYDGFIGIFHDNYFTVMIIVRRGKET